MKRFYLIPLVVLLLSIISAHAQQAAPQAEGEGFTLEKCIEYALKNSNTMKNAELDEQIANAKVKETRGIGLPQISGSVSLMHNNKLQRFFNTYAVAQAFSGEDEITKEPLLNIPGVENSDIVGLVSPFQLKSSGDAKISATQIIFSGSYIVGLQAASAYRELSVRTTQQSKVETISQVTKAYYNALINQERMELFTANISRVDSLLRTTKALNENGFAESIDVDRIQVALNNLVTQRDNFTNLQELSVELLKFQMNYPMDQSLKIKGDIGSVVVETNPDVYKADFNYSQRIDYNILETQRKLQSLNIKNNYAGSLPSLVAFGNLGYFTQSPTISGLFKTNTDIDDNGSAGPDKWYSYSNFGVTLNIPLFSGLQGSYRIQQQKLALMKIENGFSTLKSGIDIEIKSSTTTYKNALRSLESQKANTALAENIARVTKIKYEQGVGSNLEVVEAESGLREAQVNYYNALFDALVAKVDLDKAYGKLVPAQPQEK